MVDGPKITNNFNYETFIVHTFFVYFAINNIISLLHNLSKPNRASELDSMTNTLLFECACRFCEFGA